jgi:hypothetical protein
MADFDDYQWLVADPSAAEALAAFTDDERTELKQLGALRKTLAPERARLVIEQLGLRRRAVDKFGPLAAAMFFTPVQLEQATDCAVAAYKAERFRCADDHVVHDFCCGIGGDLMALATTCLAIGWEIDPVTALLAQTNVDVARTFGLLRNGRAAVRQSDVADAVPGANDRWHVDPDRRATGRRSTTLELHSPGPAVIDRWRAASAGAVKLSPASDAPTAWQREGELEWVSHRRECRQLVVWFGELATAPGERRATLIDSPSANCERPFPDRATTATFCGSADEMGSVAEAPLRYVYDPDPAVVAARLTGAISNRHELASLGAGGVYLTGEQAIKDPLLAAFEVLEALPLRAAVVAPWLRARGVGRVEIKKRGVTIDPEKFRRELKLQGDNEATIILTRAGKRQLAIVAKRC